MTKHTFRKCFSTTSIKVKLLAALLLICPGLSWSAVIQSIGHESVSTDKVSVVITTNEPVSAPLSFEINNPARIAFDFPDTQSALSTKRVPINVGFLNDINVASHKSRTRLVLNLSKQTNYSTRTQGNRFYIDLHSGTSNATYKTSSVANSNVLNYSTSPKINKVDFRRGEKGEGRLVVGLSNRNMPVNVYKKGSKVIAEFVGADIPRDYTQRLDVLDFASPAKYIDVAKTAKGVLFTITPNTDAFEHLAYQSDEMFTLELKPMSKVDQERKARDKFGFTGERLSLNFQDIDTRTVLQLISDFTGTNVVVSDAVGGTLTLRLKDVPWDQALDIILKTKGLSKRESGNVMLIAPAAELAAQEKIALEARKQVEQLAPIRSEFIRVNYAKAADMAKLISSASSGGEGEEGGSKSGMLSPRGSMTVDERTNTILINDTSEAIDNIRQVVERLDVPVKQVLIESRIVIASEDFNKSLGARFGVVGDGLSRPNNGNGQILTTSLDTTKEIINGETVDLQNALNFNSPIGGGGKVGLSISKLADGSLLNLELSALQAEGNGEIVSTPRVITADQKEASIEQGVEVPYLESSPSGAASVSFKKAVLGLRVTPQVTPDENIILDLKVSQDTIGTVFNGTPSIDTRKVQTQVLAADGETIVLGGIFVDETNNSVTKVPFFGDLPGVGKFFRSTIKTNKKREILIFVTPKIIKSAATRN